MEPVRNKPISIIVAIAENNAIGKNNQLLWRLSGDLQRFKKITTGHKIVMGRNTFLSLPKGALPNRTNVVLSDRPEEKFENCEMVHSFEEALAACDEKEETFIIGGGMIYKLFLPHATRLYITRVHKIFNADVFFPDINYDHWNEIQRESFSSTKAGEPDHSFLIYERKK